MLWLAFFKPIIAIFKPVVVVWAGLNALDDLSVLMRLARLGSIVLPGTDKSDMCDVCDDVMGDILTMGGIDAIPCRLACLRIPQCVQMCENIKEVSANSSKFPCIAAGYCDAIEEGTVDSDIECSVAPILRCVPNRYCKAVRKGFRMSCELKPGIGRWVGMKNAVGNHAAAIADGLLAQPHCGEEGAGPYCIAQPTGMGVFAELLGHVLSLVYGGIQTVISIETPGGDDDRQWLTFWLVLTLLLFVERFLARVLLSTFPLYYEAKLGLLVWLMVGDGADALYRRLRRLLVTLLPFVARQYKRSQRAEAAAELETLRAACPSLVTEALKQAAAASSSAAAAHTAAGGARGGGAKPPAWLLAPVASRDLPADAPCWHEVVKDEGEGEGEGEEASGGDDDPEQQLQVVSSYLLTPAGGAALAASSLSTHAKDTLLEAASARASFHPRFVRVRVVGVPASPPHAALPAMDVAGPLAQFLGDGGGGGLCDAYVTCRVVDEAGAAYPPRGSSTRPRYRSVRPQWRQTLEMALRGGRIRPDGLYRNETVATSSLKLAVFDADVGVWGWLLLAAEVALLGLGVAAVAAYVVGFADNLSLAQLRMATAGAASVAATVVVAYVVHVRFAADDDPIGEATVPLALLMDQQEHTLLLRLALPECVHESFGEADSAARLFRRQATEAKLATREGRAARDGRGIVKVVLSASER